MRAFAKASGNFLVAACTRRGRAQSRSPEGLRPAQIGAALTSPHLHNGRGRWAIRKASEPSLLRAIPNGSISRKTTFRPRARPQSRFEFITQPGPVGFGPSSAVVPLTVRFQEPFYGILSSFHSHKDAKILTHRDSDRDLTRYIRTFATRA